MIIRWLVAFFRRRKIKREQELHEVLAMHRAMFVAMGALDAQLHEHDGIDTQNDA